MQENNKRIAKNTLMLYVRMLFAMFVTLYTSRVILNSLGEVDFGLYGVVAGVISIFSFINGALGAATSRYLTFELGLGNTNQLKTVFRTSFVIHFCMAIAVVVLGEAVGVWAINNLLTIPTDRLFACNVVFQYVIVSAFFTILQVPFNATVIAHERMNVFAFISIVEVLLKLAVAYLISITTFDKLIFFGTLNLCIVLSIFIFYFFYNKRTISEFNISRNFDKPLAKEMLGFSGWSLFGNAVGMTRGQGINILMNIYFGPALNAANAVANQISAAITALSSNFTMALNPQITKSHASSEHINTKMLLFRGGKFSFFLLMLLSIPLFLETDMALNVWLKKVPESAVIFAKLIILFELTNSFTSTIGTAIQATGKIKYYQMFIGGVLLITFPAALVCYMLGGEPYTSFICAIIISIFAVFVRLIFIKKYLHISIMEYSKSVLLLALAVLICSIVPPYLLHNAMEYGWLRLISVSLLSVGSSCFFIYHIGLTKYEKEMIIGSIKEKVSKRKYSNGLH